MKNISVYIVIITGALFGNLSFVEAADEDDWRKTTILQTYLQSYDGNTSRQFGFNAGAYINADYLDSGSLEFGYNYSFIGFDHNAELTEHLFYISGRYHLFPDALPGKVTLRLDAYYGDDTLRYNVNNPPGMTGGGGMGNKMGGSSSNISESTDISAYQPQLAFINFSKTFYIDLGYAFTRYNGTADSEVDQFTPTIGFGWNESFDWLQFRGYFITVDPTSSSSSDDNYESLEIKYTHWFSDAPSSLIEFWQLAAILGERLLAIDPDAAVIYSTADKQTASFTTSVQWKLSESSRVLALVNYNQYENNTQNDDYDSLLFYVNLQRQW